jgi:hypothetical protein
MKQRQRPVTDQRNPRNWYYDKRTRKYLFFPLKHVKAVLRKNHYLPPKKITFPEKPLTVKILPEDFPLKINIRFNSEHPFYTLFPEDAHAPVPEPAGMD